MENFFLFLRSLWGSWMVWAGGILRVIPFLEDLIEPWLRRKYPKVDIWFVERGAALKKNLKLIAVICLFVGCYRAGVFEHNNAETAMYGKEGKSEAWAKYNQCDKERAVDNTLAKSCSSNLTYQQSRNDGQQDLFNRCMLSLGLKATPKPRVITTRTALIEKGAKEQNRNDSNVGILIARTNENIPKVVGEVECSAPVHFVQASIATGGGEKPGAGAIASIVMANNYQVNDRHIAISIQQPSWLTSDPLVIVFHGSGVQDNTCHFSLSQ